MMGKLCCKQLGLGWMCIAFDCILSLRFFIWFWSVDFLCYIIFCTFCYVLMRCHNWLLSLWLILSQLHINSCGFYWLNWTVCWHLDQTRKNLSVWHFLHKMFWGSSNISCDKFYRNILCQTRKHLRKMSEIWYVLWEKLIVWPLL